jgi:hypothetical protein
MKVSARTEALQRSIRTPTEYHFAILRVGNTIYPNEGSSGIFASY